MAKFLDLDGLKTFYGKIQANYPQLEEDSAGNKKIPSSYLPSYVDDVLEGYLYNSKFYEDTAHTKEITAEAGKIYTDLSTNKIYRWSGSQYTVISDTLAIGETTGTAYEGSKGAALAAAAFAKVTGDATNTLTFKNTAGDTLVSFTVNNVKNANSATYDSAGHSINNYYLYTLGGSYGSDGYNIAGYKPSSTTASATVKVPVFTAASSTAAGKLGLVPAPAANANYANQFLSADGTWKTVDIADTFIKADLEEDNYAAYRFEDMSGTTYEMPAISTDKAGIIKLGSATVLTSTYATGTAGSNGITQPLQRNASYQGGVFVPYASSSAFGVVKAGTNITISNGVISSVDTKYTLPKATTSTLGGVIVGSNLSVDANGKLSATAYTLPVATASALGGIQIGFTSTNLNRAVQLSSNKAYVALQLANGSTEGVVKSTSTTITGLTACPIASGYVYSPHTAIATADIEALFA